MSDGPVIYEVNLRPEAEIAEAFDTWLRKHVRDMLALPGFLEASISVSQETGGTPGERTVQYRLVDRAALDRYLAEDAPRMRADGIDMFGERFTANRRILEGHERLRAQPKAGSLCSNCESELLGQYCASCGQRARRRMITVWELVKEASDVLTSLDSRLWRTLGLLMFRPGVLTQNYLEGRRARYVAPLRLFLAASVIMFFTLTITTELSPEEEGVVISLDGGGADEAEKAEDPPESPTPSANDARAPGAMIEDPATTDLDPTAPGAMIEDPATTDLDPTAPGAMIEDPATTEADPPASGEAKDELEDTDDDSADDPGSVCEGDMDLNIAGPAWLTNYLTEERVRGVCHKIADDRGATLVSALRDNVPIMMFLFLPFMALVMKLAYPLSGRYYVEHLLFLVHYHSFFYLLMTVTASVAWVGTKWAPLDWLGSLLGVVAFVYPPVYLYKAMRRVYGQGHGATAIKYALLFLSYFVSLLVTFLGTVAVTAFTL